MTVDIRAGFGCLHMGFEGAADRDKTDEQFGPGYWSSVLTP